MYLEDAINNVVKVMMVSQVLKVAQYIMLMPSVQKLQPLSSLVFSSDIYLESPT